MKKLTLLAAALGLAAATTANAATSTWASTTGGTWDAATATLWTENIAFANNNDVIFGTNLTADATVDLAGAYIVNSLAFSDSDTSTAGSWIISNGGTSANTLTLGGATPTITVSALGTGKFANITAQILGVAGLTKSGAGTLVLSGVNAYSGLTTVSVGTLQIGSASALGDTTGGTTVIAGATLDLNGQAVGNEAITLNSTGVNAVGALINSSGTAASLSGAVTLGASSSIGGSGDITLSNTISGAFSITKAGTGTLTLSDANTYTGFTTISGGTLVINSIENTGSTNASALGKVSATTGRIDVGSNVTSVTLRYTGTGSTTDRVINLNGSSGGLTLDQSGTGLLKFTSALTAGGRGSKTLVLTGSTAGTGEIAGAIIDNTSTGSTRLGAAFASGATSIQLASVDGLAIGDAISGPGIPTGTTVTVTAINPVTKTVTLSTATTSAQSTLGSAYLSTNLRNLTSVTKSGTGTWTLSGANTYTGTTTVNAGTLLVNGSLASGSAVGVNNAGTVLGGTGTINGAITVGSGAILQGGTGTATGTLTTAGNVSLGAGSIIQLAVGNGAAVHSTIARTGGTWSFQSNQQFTLIDAGAVAGTTYTGLITGLTGTEAGLGSIGTWTTTNGWVGSFQLSGGQINYVLTAIPEPSTYGLMGAGALVAVSMVRRRKRAAK